MKKIVKHCVSTNVGRCHWGESQDQQWDLPAVAYFSHKSYTYIKLVSSCYLIFVIFLSLKSPHPL